MSVSDTFLAYVLEQVEGLGRVRSRRMFGAVGLYSGEHFFGLIDDNALYLKVDDGNRGDFTARGMSPFRPFPDRPGHAMAYYQVPADVIEDPELIVVWARKAVVVAAAGARRKRPAAAGRPAAAPERTAAARPAPRKGG